jgi:uncharacterized protein YndB with AHSA1/START domain
MTRSARRPQTHPSAKSGSPSGGLAVRAHKTIAAPAAAAFAAWTDSRRRAHWLAGVTLTIRKATAPDSIRLTCEDDATEIEVRIAAKGRTHCAVAVHHTQLANAQMVAERRHCWKEMLGALKHYLEDAA